MSSFTQRFSSRVESYIKYRPGYPDAVLDLLKQECGLTRGSVIADVGCGTGIFAELLLKSGCRVRGVEPNAPMREAAERLLSAYPNFTSVDASAEATGLPDACVEIVTAAQAFHWFDREKAKAEFARILKPGGWVALIWNERHVATTPFLRDYEDVLMRMGTDYNTVRSRCEQIDDGAFGAFFGAAGYRVASFPNRQDFDLDGLIGRVKSSSYTPEPGDPGFEPLMAALAELFERHQVGGGVAFEYDTRVYYGRPPSNE
jgi:SAM-dependent methyltransferase